MKVVIKLGGVNGSGKTTVARELINAANCFPSPFVLESDKPTIIHKGQMYGLDVWVLGKYESACGGMDTISDKHDRYGMIRDIVKMRGNKAPDIVFFEGLITGKTYGALGALSEQHFKRKQADWLYAFMDTPFDVAAARVLQRRLAAGNTADFDPERTMRSTYDSCVRLEAYLRGTATSNRVEINVEHHVHSVNHKHKPAKAVEALMDKAMEIYNARR